MKRKLEEIEKVDYVLCEICTDKIYDYELTGQNYFCSCDCYSVYVLSKQQTYLHEKPITRTFSSENLDNDNMSEKSYDSWGSVNDPEGYAQAFHTAFEMIKDV